MLTQQSDKFCPECGQPLTYRLGECECTACDYREVSSPSGESSYSPGTVQSDQHVTIPPPPPPGSSVYQSHHAQTGSMLRTNGDVNRVEREKRAFYTGQSLLVFNTLLFTTMNLNNPYGKMLGVDYAAQAGMSSDAFSLLVILFYATQIAGVIGAIVLLHINEIWAKWFGALGAVIAVMVILMSLGNRAIAVIANDMHILFAVIEIAIMIWLFSIFTRELKELQVIAKSDD